MVAVGGHLIPIRVLIVDDHELVSAGFRMILDAQPDIEVVGVAADGAEAISLADARAPDVILMDIRMPGMDGIEATRQLTGTGREHRPRVVILTTYDLDEYVFDALTAGAAGFLLKHVRPEELVSGVRLVAGGEAILAPTVTRRLIEEFASRRPARRPQAPPVESLTPREGEVLAQLARGLSNAEIAAALHVGEATAKTHVAHLLDKLGLRDRVQAVIYAYERGLVQPGSS